MVLFLKYRHHPVTVVKVMAEDSADDAIWWARGYVLTTRMEMEALPYLYHWMYFDLTKRRYVIDDAALLPIDLQSCQCAWI